MAHVTADYIHQPLYVITTVTNAARWKTRWKHYQRFAKYVKHSGGVLVTVEAAFGDRHHALAAGETEHGTSIHPVAPTKEAEFHTARTKDPHLYIQLRTSEELWLKENMQDIGIGRLPDDWQYCALVDADVMFARSNWVGETIHQLQHYQVVQMFSEAQDMGPRYAHVQSHLGFVYCYLKGDGKPPVEPGGGTGYQPAKKRGAPMRYHPGYAWAYRREAIDALGGLVDFAIAGAGDRHMAYGLFGHMADSIHGGMHPRYTERLLQWEYLAQKHIRHNVGYMSGLLLHYWHGRKLQRSYHKRWALLVDTQFNPDTDLAYDWQGVLRLVDHGDERSRRLRDGLKRYFLSRNEDSIELEGLGQDEWSLDEPTVR